MIDKNLRFYLKLFWQTFSLSAFTFGGGYVIVPLMQKRFVEKEKWIDETEMLDIVAIAQSSPGIIAVNASILVGYKLAGVLGALLTTVATVLPPLITISIISMFYTGFRDSPIVSAVLFAMQPAVAAVIVDATIKMGKTALKTDRIQSLILMIACFVLAFIFNVNAAVIILTCAALGAVKAIIVGKAARSGKLGGGQ